MDDLLLELRQDGGRRERQQSEDRKLLGGFRGSGDRTHAHAPGDHRTRRSIYFSSLSSLS
ncbi:hypothetical protein IGI04_014781 [Brassica rapa subsp. trilocularis]|uniref:Uncharacterized protein n=1 Tax=Brassica rapa subsp. trilocularis TaxID=1813537 RepID=A0ABQ7MN65_BRACM|nr:hypothetical protein IGI04_014781 [Brassica rapa subsp. trilocularis]